MCIRDREYPVHQQTQDYVKALNHLYRTHPALYEMDYDPEGFQWINCSYDQDSMVIFIRRSKKADEMCIRDRAICAATPISANITTES